MPRGAFRSLRKTLVGLKKLCILFIKLVKLLWIPFRSLSRFSAYHPTFQTSIPALLSDYRNTNFTLQDGYSEWKGPGGLVLLETQSSLVGLLQMKQFRTFWELSSFAISPEYQGHGYGKRMIQACLDSVDSPVCLRVKQENHAQRLYERLGFVKECASDGRYCMKYSQHC